MKPAGAERELAGVADQDIEADGGQRDRLRKGIRIACSQYSLAISGTTTKAKTSTKITMTMRSWVIGKIAWSAPL